jgi:hypothetical protein
MKRLRLLAPLALVRLTPSKAARADEPAVTLAPPVSTPVSTEWYGWETIATDGGSALALTLGTVSDNPGAQWGLSIAGFAGYGLGAPIMHAARGRWKTAVADLGLRVGAVLVGGLVGLGIGTAAVSSKPACPGLTSSSSCAPFLYGLDTQVNGMMIGAAVGAVTASVLDATVLARETRHHADTPSTGFRWSPTLAPLPGGAAGGVAGSF